MAVVNLAAMLLTVVRIAVPATTWFIFPTPSSFPALGTELAYALDVSRTGVAPVLPLAGLIAMLAVLFWILGALLVWGLRREHPYPAVLAPLVAYLQFATMDRRRSGPWTVAFVLLLGLALLAVAADRRRRGTGLLTTGPGRVAVARTRPALVGGRPGRAGRADPGLHHRPGRDAAPQRAARLAGRPRPSPAASTAASPTTPSSASASNWSTRPTPRS